MSIYKYQYRPVVNGETLMIPIPIKTYCIYVERFSFRGA